MVRLSSVAAFIFVSVGRSSSAWSPSSNPLHVLRSVPARHQSARSARLESFRVASIHSSHDEEAAPASYLPDGIILSDDVHQMNDKKSNNDVWNAAALVGAAALFSASPANAASSDAVPSALVAYGHYFSLLAIMGCITAERCTVKPNMSIDEEKLLGYADIGYGLFGTLLFVSGYYRAVDYGKGWDFYSHEPIFWLKMAGLGILTGLSLFPTITIIKRTVAIQQGKDLEPMSEKLANRMKSILNAEISAIIVIPITATLMSRGVGYVNDFPTEIVGPVGCGLVTAAAVAKYVSEALSWSEDELSETTLNLTDEK
jgi:putative membrane protein|uniref:Uncharacterized protein n=1 Tax=Attheya septentrionalis TaxID=420275 RepID=A0A7S2UMI6_9STRA|mmetsp:Transcript_4844/g.8505  ORF Transcript_4844/g.8505 Transcript_4844/m.8505 type:complete len:315 (+) Transcript_4844:80-1024(+)|eukprot:CAMPEP_0198284828 /NCGR_PEP_ID=MMETSP1449-20131203/4237_1 /TAXON_ID=420275 /ORGANISM="Attheya septentrionalis, Strain CCMP2084" /LENGTH=314 /DNA_ID=CAMNT_0043982045 /DNA_START=49 /DNA_END=993 /DNA_ORIENTATION=-